jgi:hypothetical protein
LLPVSKNSQAQNCAASRPSAAQARPAPGNFEGLKRATAVPGKVIEVLVRAHIDEWMEKTLKHLIDGGLPEEVRERLRREFPKHWPAPQRSESIDETGY